MQQLLKVYFLLCCFIISNEQIQGQDATTTELLKKQKESAVYFASGSSELSSKSQEVLNAFLKDQPRLELAQFRLQAFTDDVGSPERNALLAKKRATEVQAYLSQQGIVTNNIKIQAFQQLHLNPDEDVAKQRANNRRVVVELWGVALETNEEFSENTFTIEEFFNRNPKNYQQNFSFSAAKGTVIEGEKGTVLQIPANCFVDSKGNVVNGEISFLLQEAYSYSDMLFQNLNTVSDGQLLETGGMLFIEAKDQAGNVLEIREGAEITAAMASTAAKLPGMQTFNGVVDSTDNSVNWVPTNQPVRSSDQNYANLWNQGMRIGGGLYQKSSLGKRLVGLQEIPVWELRLPREVEKPRFNMRLPKYPRLKETLKPNKATLMAKIVQRSHESDVNYNRKIRKKYVSLQKSYRKKVQNNRTKKATYRRDSSRYERALVKHEKNVLKYGLYNEEMRFVLEEMYDNMTNFELKLYRDEYYKLQTFARQFRQRNALMCGGKVFIENALTQKKAVYDTVAQELRIKLSSISLTPFAEKECQLIETCWSKKLSKKLSSYSLRHNYNPSQFRSNRYRVANIYNRVTETGHLKPYRLRQIRKMKDKIDNLYNYKQLHKIDQEVQETQKKTLPLIAQFLDMEEATIDLQKEFLEVKTELNILTPTDVADIYSNAMRIQNAGWINCDRFIKGSNLTTLEVVTEHTQDTRVLVLFEGAMKSIMAGIPYQKSFKIDRIPSDRAIKLIGFRVVGDAMEVFVEEGTVQSLNGVKPTFKKKTVEEVEAMMMAI